MIHVWFITWAMLAGNLLGPGVAQDGECGLITDMNSNGTVDLEDVALFQNSFDGDSGLKVRWVVE